MLWISQWILKWKGKLSFRYLIRKTRSAQKCVRRHRKFSACGEDLYARSCQRLSLYPMLQPGLHCFYLEHDWLFPQLSSLHQQLTQRNESRIACLRKGSAMTDDKPIHHWLGHLGVSAKDVEDRQLEGSDGSPEFFKTGTTEAGGSVAFITQFTENRSQFGSTLLNDYYRDSIGSICFVGIKVRDDSGKQGWGHMHITKQRFSSKWEVKQGFSKWEFAGKAFSKGW